MPVIPDESHPGGAVDVLAERLVALRRDRGWRREELAVRAGLTLGTIAALERGDRPAHLLTVERLAAAFGVEVADLLAP